MEPIQLKDLAEMKVGTLRDARALISTGASLVYSFKYPSALFLGNIPRQAVVIWRYPNTETLFIQKAGWTYFTWSHSTELLILTGLVSHVYEFDKLRVRLTFYVFDPIKFASSIKASELNELFDKFLNQMFANKQNEDFETAENLHYISVKFMEANREFQKYGVAVTAIDPPGFNNFV